MKRTTEMKLISKISARAAVLLLIAVMIIPGLFVTGCGDGRGAAGAGQKASAEPENTEFEPAEFIWSGGSGKIRMTCPLVSIRDGQAYALIRISSPHYTWLKVDGTEYTGKNGEDYSEFEIPVVLDEDMEISGQTTAMSQPHEISYTIHISTASGSSSGAAETEGTDSDTGGAAAAAAEGAGAAESPEASVEAARKAGPPEIGGLAFERAMDPEYAECFNVFYYSGGYKLLDIYGRGRYLVIPEGMDAPEGVQTSAQESPFAALSSDGEEIVLLYQPLDRIYLAATAVMSLFDGVGAIDRVRLTGTAQNGWYLDAPVRALDAGTMLYAGKYSEPDYELLVGEGCDLAVESTMILHTPEVQEKIEELGIPVLTDYSSYEDHPLGRAEWIRFYGALTDCEAQADAFFDGQKEVMEAQKKYEPSGSTVAVFYISDDGRVAVRRPDDYIVRMIEMAGGTYAFPELEEAAGGSTTVSLTMEQFYDQAVDADFLIYNATIADAPEDLTDLLGKSELLADFKAFREGNVWTTEKSLYQETGRIGQFIPDVHAMLTGETEAGMTFLRHVG